jgi:hypothetical protein
MRNVTGTLLKVIILSLILILLLTPIASAQPLYSHILGDFFYYCFAFWLVLTVILIVYVYGDAERRDRNGIKWVVIVILLNVTGLFIWIFVRPPLQKPPPLVKRQ